MELYALPSQKKYPIQTPLQIREASFYFQKYAHLFSPSEQIEFAENLYTAAKKQSTETELPGQIYKLANLDSASKGSKQLFLKLAEDGVAYPLAYFSWEKKASWDWLKNQRAKDILGEEAFMAIQEADDAEKSVIYDTLPLTVKEALENL